MKCTPPPRISPFFCLPLQGNARDVAAYGAGSLPQTVLSSSDPTPHYVGEGVQTCPAELSEEEKMLP